MRRSIDGPALKTLQLSIARHGILEPLLVRPSGGDGPAYEIVSGHRRYAAARDLAFVRVPVTVRVLDDEAAFSVAIHENVHRKSISAIEEALAYSHIIISGAVPSQAELARQIGVTEARVSQKIGLLNLAPDLVEFLLTGQGAVMTERHLRHFRQVPPEQQLELARMVVDEGLSSNRLLRHIKSKCSPLQPPSGSEGGGRFWTTLGNTRYKISDRKMIIEIGGSTKEEFINDLQLLLARLAR